MTELIYLHSDEFCGAQNTPRLQKLIDVFVERIKDSNSKVALYALQTMKEWISVFNTSLDPVLVTLIPVLCTNLSSTNTTVKMLTSQILTDGLKNGLCDPKYGKAGPKSLIQCMQIMNGLLMFGGSTTSSGGSSTGNSGNSSYAPNGSAQSGGGDGGVQLNALNSVKCKAGMMEVQLSKSNDFHGSNCFFIIPGLLQKLMRCDKNHLSSTSLNNVSENSNVNTKPPLERLVQKHFVPMFGRLVVNQQHVQDLNKNRELKNAFKELFILCTQIVGGHESMMDMFNSSIAGIGAGVIREKLLSMLSGK